MLLCTVVTESISVKILWKVNKYEYEKSKDSQFPAGIRSSYLIHFPAVLQYAITHSENLKMGKSPIKKP